MSLSAVKNVISMNEKLSKPLVSLIVWNETRGSNSPNALLGNKIYQTFVLPHQLDSQISKIGQVVTEKLTFQPSITYCIYNVFIKSRDTSV